MVLFLFGISLIGIPAGLILLIIGRFKKKKLKGGSVLGVSVILFFASLVMYDSDDNKEKVEVTSKTQDLEKEKASEEAKKENKESKEEEKLAKKEEERKAKEAEQKAKDEAKLKKEQASKEEKAKEKAEADAKVKSKEEEKLTKQKDYYIKSTQPAIDEWVKTYDQLWNNIWKPTFEAIGNGNRDVYTAYDNMKSLKEGYRALSLKKSVPVEGLSKDQQKTIKEAMSDLSYAAISRQLAAEKAMKMFDTSNFSPSQMDKIKSDVSAADTQLMKGVIGITKIKQELGLIEETKN